MHTDQAQVSVLVGNYKLVLDTYLTSTNFDLYLKRPFILEGLFHGDYFLFTVIVIGAIAAATAFGVAKLIQA